MSLPVNNSYFRIHDYINESPEHFEDLLHYLSTQINIAEANLLINTMNNVNVNHEAALIESLKKPKQNIQNSIKTIQENIETIDNLKSKALIIDYNKRNDDSFLVKKRLSKLMLSRYFY